MKDFRCVFFDLDHTLWDYDTNSRETLVELFERHSLESLGVPGADDFYNRFVEVNDRLWEQYDRGQIDSEVLRTTRFNQVLQAFDLDDHGLAMKISDNYIDECPRKGHLMPFAVDILEYLHDKYPMTVITNGFDQTQHAKIEAAGITKYFKQVITSQRAGKRKPEKEIFQLALELNASRPHEALMVGDNLLTDIVGARNVSMDAVFFNPKKIAHTEKVDYEIHRLSELRTIL